MTADKFRSAAEFVWATPAGAVRSMAGVEIEALIAACEWAPDQRRAVGFRLTPAHDVAGYLDQALDALAQAALQLWPHWWGGVELPERDDALGRQAAVLAARQAAESVPGVSSAWAEAAAARALSALLPRAKGLERVSEARQLVLAISPAGLAIVVDVAEPMNGYALVPALEGLARHARASVTALFGRLPAPAPPLDRILYAAREFREPVQTEEPAAPEVWMAPARGLPHPISEIEQRLAAAIVAAPDLVDLFEFNRTVTTVHGATPRVDLVWRAGRLVVEVDGYQSHGNRLSFQHDRHRDYELTLTGYTVLRLTNDEISDDIERALAKIRDLVAVCRHRGGRG